MSGLIEREVSHAALWCRRLALFSLPYFFLTVLLHRFDKISANQAMGLMGFGLVLVLLSILLALRSIVSLWQLGAKGGKAMVSGLFIALLVLGPFIYYSAQAVRFPAINDVATDYDPVPEFSDTTIITRRMIGVSPDNEVATEPNEGLVLQVTSSYSNLGSRRYPAGPLRVLKAVQELLKEREWNIVNLRGLDNYNQDRDTDDSDASTDTKNSATGLQTADQNDIFVDAVAESLIFKFENDVVIKIISEDENTLVQMRSASRWGVHDFGANARLIEKFMNDLDQALIGIAGEG